MGPSFCQCCDHSALVTRDFVPADATFSTSPFLSVVGQLDPSGTKKANFLIKGTQVSLDVMAFPTHILRQ